MNDITRRDAMKALAAGSAGWSLSSALGIGTADQVLQQAVRDQSLDTSYPAIARLPTSRIPVTK